MLIITSVKVFANTDLYIQTEKLYEQKKYDEAILIYESILSSKLTSPKLYYNLGNCYFKTNQIGKAIYNYELAKKINPKDSTEVSSIYTGTKISFYNYCKGLFNKSRPKLFVVSKVSPPGPKAFCN